VSYMLRFTKQAEKDIRQLTPKLQEKLKKILREQIALDPYQGKPLVGDLKGCYSVRLTLKDRIVYQIDDETITVIILRTKTHYGD